jgi:predicted enzyme related to lactoylglutathione lyase
VYSNLKFEKQLMTNQMNTIGYFEIQSSEPSREVNFYKSIFGWKFFREEKLPIEYYRIETKTINGGLLKRPSKVPPMGNGTNAFVCSVQVENFDKTSEVIQKAGGQVALPKFAIPGRCWQGYFVDLDNNTFGIFEVDENAL